MEGISCLPSKTNDAREDQEITERNSRPREGAPLTWLTHQPLALTVRDDDVSALNPGLPSGPFNPNSHRTLEAGLRQWVEDQTQLSLGYVEQLYTFGDRGRLRSIKDPKLHLVSVGTTQAKRVIIDVQEFEDLPA